MTDKLEDQEGEEADENSQRGEIAEKIKTLVQNSRVHLAAATAGAIGLGVIVVAVAWIVWGMWSGIAAGVGIVGGLVAPWVYVRVLFTPLGSGVLSSAFFILAQLSYGAGALVRRDDGGYEWSRLREDDQGLFTVLQNGTEVRIQGDKSDLPTVAWAKLAVVEEKTERNMSRFTVDETYRDVRPDPRTDGEMVETPLALADGGNAGWHLDSSKLARWARGTGSNELARNGRRKALEEEGGEQQISQLVTMIGAAVLLVMGFVLGAGAMMLT